MGCLLVALHLPCASSNCVNALFILFGQLSQALGCDLLNSIHVITFFFLICDFSQALGCDLLNAVHTIISRSF